jgi:hypothetical protein
LNRKFHSSKQLVVWVVPGPPPAQSKPAQQQNKAVRILTTPCRIVNEKLAERKRKKEQQQLSGYPPRQQTQQQPFYNEPYPDYDDEFDRHSARSPARQEWGNHRRSHSYQDNGGRYVRA